MNYWLMKSEPDVYGIADLRRDRTTIWDGVRNYQARNFLREMQPGDRIFYYHSNTIPPGIVGLAKVAEARIIDPSQFEATSKYFDPKSSPTAPRWQTVAIEFDQMFAEIITLDALRQTFTPEELLVVRQGNRLSVLPVLATVAERLLAIAQVS
ncbi:MAG: EVE domain-containing protein [Timaviella obliquedivisa GSE-PSE-MK23-08B]|jgi:predicted RNA-binding protein with PUA-like domain|nr:EVE domain-containing protein [Timaviella obliquedivisa GSE-PSE-MK23-08B]